MTSLAESCARKGVRGSQAEFDEAPQGVTLDDPSSISLTANRLWQLWRQGFSPAFIKALLLGRTSILNDRPDLLRKGKQREEPFSTGYSR